ncbi:hypothetical protein [Leptotrichia sp. OH3620_COT-345]|nr:hypothetical protein [Leptotrichia sp. OH3620_COT-345]
MQKGWTPADFKNVNNELWEYYIAVAELESEKKKSITLEEFLSL